MNGLTVHTPPGLPRVSGAFGTQPPVYSLKQASKEIRRPINAEFDELSRSDISVVEGVISEYGRMTLYALESAVDAAKSMTVDELFAAVGRTGFLEDVEASQGIHRRLGGRGKKFE